MAHANLRSHHSSSNIANMLAFLCNSGHANMLAPLRSTAHSHMPRQRQTGREREREREHVFKRHSGGCGVRKAAGVLNAVEADPTEALQSTSVSSEVWEGAVTSVLPQVAVGKGGFPVERSEINSKTIET